jgi:hypothetical protein
VREFTTSGNLTVIPAIASHAPAPSFARAVVRTTWYVEGHIAPGDDFVDVLNRQVSQCDVLLIGPRWAELMAARVGDETTSLRSSFKRHCGRAKG